MEGDVQVDPRATRSGGERRTVTTLFADVRGFTPLASRLSPDQALEVINAMFVRLGEVVASEDGMVSRVLGNGLLALFGAPVPLDEHATAAARAALAVRARLEPVTSMARSLGAGIGLNTGAVIAGPIGTPAATGYSVVGHAVTVAARLGAVAAAGQILVGPGTAALLSSEFDVRDRGTFALDGLGPTAVFELVR